MCCLALTIVFYNRVCADIVQSMPQFHGPDKVTIMVLLVLLMLFTGGASIRYCGYPKRFQCESRNYWKYFDAVSRRMLEG